MCLCFIEFIKRVVEKSYNATLANSIMKSAIVRFYSSYGIKTTLKPHVWRKTIINLVFCTQSCYGRHSVFP